MQNIMINILLFIIIELFIMYLFYICLGDLLEEKIKKAYNKDKEDKKEIFLTKCSHCGKRIAVLTNKDRFIHELFACNDCIPKNSCCRNNIDQAKETDLFDEVNMEVNF